MVGRVLGVLRPRPLEDELRAAGPAARAVRRVGGRLGAAETVTCSTSAELAPSPTHPRRATGILAFCTTTDHKRIGLAYMGTAFVFFLIGGAMAEVMRAQLAQPDQSLVSSDAYNQLFTMHGTIMLLLFVEPVRHRAGQLPRAAADRRLRRRLPPPQRPRLLADAVRRHRDDGRLPHRQRRRQVRLVRLLAAHERRAHARPRRRPLDRGHRPARRVGRDHRREPRGHRVHDAGARA